MKVKFSDLHLEAPNAAVAVENLARGKGPRTESAPLTTVFGGKRVVLDGHHRTVQALLRAGNDPDGEIEVEHTDAPKGFEGYEGKDWRSLAGGLTSPQLLRGTIREVAKKMVAKHAPVKLARKKVEPVTLPSDYPMSVWAVSPGKTRPYAQHKLGMLADLLDEHELPGAAFLREASQTPDQHKFNAAGQEKEFRGRVPNDKDLEVELGRTTDGVPEGGLSGDGFYRGFYGKLLPSVPELIRRASPRFRDDQRQRMAGSAHRLPLLGVRVPVHGYHFLPIRDYDHAAQLMFDWPEEARDQMLAHLSTQEGRHYPEFARPVEGPEKLARKPDPIKARNHSADIKALLAGLYLDVFRAHMAYVHHIVNASPYTPVGPLPAAQVLADKFDEVHGAEHPFSHILRRGSFTTELGYNRSETLARALESGSEHYGERTGLTLNRFFSAGKPTAPAVVLTLKHPSTQRPMSITSVMQPDELHEFIDKHVPLRDKDRWRDAANMQNWKRTTPEKLARVKAPAEGAIAGGGTSSGGIAAGGGEFMAKPRLTIREAVTAFYKRKKRGAKKLAKKKVAAPEHLRVGAPFKAPTDPLPLDPATEVHSVLRDVRGRGDSIEDRTRSLSVGEVKQIEDLVGLPEAHPARLTRSVKAVRKALAAGHTDKRLGDGADEIPISLDQATAFLHKVATHRMKGADAKVRKHLQDPTVSSPARLAYLIAHLGHEAKVANKLFEGGEGADEWYGNHVAVMARHLRDSFGKHDPELWGAPDAATGRLKLDPKGRQPASVTLAKLLVAATSGGEKPDRNYAVAHKMISAAVKKADGDPNWFAHLPTHQTEDFDGWIDKVLDWHAKHKEGDKTLTDEDVRRPGTDLNDRAAWWHRVVRPLPRELGGNRGADDAIGNKSPTGGYGYTTIRGHVIDDPEHLHDRKVTFLEKGKAGWLSPYPGRDRLGDKGKGAADRTDSPDGEVDFAHRNRGAKTKQANLPITDALGYIQPKLYSARGATVNKHIKLLQTVIQSFVKEAGDSRGGLKRAAAFFTDPQTAADVVARTRKIAEFAPTEAKRIAQSLKDNKSMFFEDDALPGAFILGPKFGAFSQNLHLDVPAGKEWNAWRERYGAHLTADLWWSRTWNRLLGTMFEGGKRVEAPRGGKSAAHPERKVMRKVAHEALKRVSSDLGLRNVAELQAALWYSEQQLYRMFGVKSDSRSYLDGVRFLAPGRYALHKDGAIHVEGEARSRGEGAARKGSGEAGSPDAPRGPDAAKRKADGGAG